MKPKSLCGGEWCMLVGEWRVVVCNCKKLFILQAKFFYKTFTNLTRTRMLIRPHEGPAYYEQYPLALYWLDL